MNFHDFLMEVAEPDLKSVILMIIITAYVFSTNKVIDLCKQFVGSFCGDNLATTLLAYMLLLAVIHLFSGLIVFVLDRVFPQLKKIK